MIKVSHAELRAERIGILGFAIHAAHLSWAIALTEAMNANGSIATYGYFLPLLAIALLLEMLRWSRLGKRLLSFGGPYSAAVAIDSINRDFLMFTWYIPPPVPPFKLLERYTAKVPEGEHTKKSSIFFSEFWLKSEITPVLIGALCLAYGLAPSTPPNFYGLGKFFLASYVFWFFLFGLFGKIFAVFIYALLEKTFKGNGQ